MDEMLKYRAVKLQQELSMYTRWRCGECDKQSVILASCNSKFWIYMIRIDIYLKQARGKRSSDWPPAGQAHGRLWVELRPLVVDGSHPFGHVCHMSRPPWLLPSPHLLARRVRGAAARIWVPTVRTVRSGVWRLCTSSLFRYRPEGFLVSLGASTVRGNPHGRSIKSKRKW